MNSAKRRSFLRANKWISKSTVTSTNIWSRHSVIDVLSRFSTWMADLSLAEVSFFGRIARPSWTVEVGSLPLSPSVDWVVGLGPKFVPNGSFTVQDFEVLKVNLAGLRRKLRNLVFFHWTPWSKPLIGPTTTYELPQVRGSSSWEAPSVLSTVEDAFCKFRHKVLNRAAHTLLSSSGSHKLGNRLYSHGVEQLTKLHEDGRITLNIADKG
jgi:hypothetical protein